MITVLAIRNNKLNDQASKLFHTDIPTPELEKEIIKHLVFDHEEGVIFGKLTLIFLCNGVPIFQYCTTKGVFTFAHQAIWVKDAEKLEDWFMTLIPKVEQEIKTREHVRRLRKEEELKRVYIPPELEQIISTQLELYKKDFE